MRALSAFLHGPRFATDGYVYSRDSFMDYYGKHGNETWIMAAFRTYQLQVVHGVTILDRSNFTDWRLAWDSELSRPTD